jgi:hypothetical protein
VTRPSLYLETTIASYLAARPSRDLIVAAHQQLTRQWWDNRRTSFDLFVSELVIEELNVGDAERAAHRLKLIEPIQVLSTSLDAQQLTLALIEEGPIPQKAAADAAHIAIATVYGCEYLLT